MEKATLIISLPATTNEFIPNTPQQGRLLAPREYYRSLIRERCQRNSRGGLATILRGLGAPSDQKSPHKEQRLQVRQKHASKNP